MKQGVQLVGGGIKCDNPSCGYADTTVKVEDYKNWLNKPCPKCGSNLLTEADYENVQMLCKLANSVNDLVEKFDLPVDATEHTTIVHMNGTGEMEFELCETAANGSQIDFGGQAAEDVLREFADSLDWTYVSMDTHLSEDFIREFADRVDWQSISKYQELSEDFIREFVDRVDWFNIVAFQKVSDEFVKEFADRL